jgi:SEC-C motif-containing protein
MTNACACGSQKPLPECCLPLIQGQQKPKTAEELLRARYTAFTRGDVDYIVATHHSKTSDQMKREEIEEWSKGSEWLGMTVHQKTGGEATDEKGTIIFHAQYKQADKVTDHWENSLFEKEDGQWKFLDAQGVHHGTFRRAEPKIGRNDPCACGSGKKFKKCCAA